MIKIFIRNMLVVALVVQNSYFSGGLLLMDFELNGEQYNGVYVEDMHEMFNDAMEQDIINTGVVYIENKGE